MGAPRGHRGLGIDTYATRCVECGLVIDGGTDGCHLVFERFLARDFSNALFFRMHRMLVDTYCLQHPDRYCRSAKSLAAHLAGLHWLIRHPDESRAVGPDFLHRWLSGRADPMKPELPAFRGQLTIGDIDETADAITYAGALESWARSTWDAYEILHPIAEQWLQEAEAARR